MVGEYTEKVEIYKNIIKNNGIVTEDGEVIKPHESCLDNIVMDLINIEEDKKNKTQEILKWKQERDEFKEEIINNCGHFYFNYYNRLLDKLKPQYLTRFLYLCCYLNYDNLLVINKTTRHIPIYDEELQGLLKLSKAETYNTRNALIEKELIIINEDKTISINNTYCKKGEIMKNNKTEKVRMFENGIKELYENSKPSEHKQLALLFEMLPYVNLRFNVICENPREEVEERIKPYSLKQLSVLLKQSNVTRFKKNLMSMSVNEEPVICINEIKNKKMITINPKVYYKGVNINELKSLISLFTMSENVIK